MPSSTIHNYTSMMAISSVRDHEHSTDGSSSHDNDADRGRDREVSSVGDHSSPMSRSGRKRAKQERRQKIKEGEVAEAFASGSVLGKSCDGASIQEILVTSMRTSGCVPHVDTWASPILKSTEGDDTTASSRSKLRKGKRDLLRSWFATPKEDVDEHNTVDVNANVEGNLYEQPPFPIGTHHTDATRAGCRSPDGSIVLSVSGYAPTTEDIFGGEEPLDHNASLCSVVSSPHISVRNSRPRDTVRSIQALRESVSSCDDSLFDNQAITDSSPRHFVDDGTVKSHPSNVDKSNDDESSSFSTFSNSLQLDDPHNGLPLSVWHLKEDNRVSSVTSNLNPLNEVDLDGNSDKNHRPLSTLGIQSLISIYASSPMRPLGTCSPSSTSLRSGSISKGSFIPTQAHTRPNSPQTQHRQQHSFMINGATLGNDLLGDASTTDLTTNLCALQVSGLKIVKGSKKRHAVSFNGDVYNLATWDSEDLGPFVLPDTAASSHEDRKLHSNNSGFCGSVDLHHQSPLWNTCSESQCSLSVLTSYFERSRSPQAASTSEVTNASQFSPLGERTSPHCPLGRDVRPLSTSLSTGIADNCIQIDTSVANIRWGTTEKEKLPANKDCSVLGGFQLPESARALQRERACSLLSESHLSISSQSVLCVSTSITSARRNTADIPEHKCRTYLSQLGRNHSETSASSIQICSSEGPVGSSQSKNFYDNVHFVSEGPSSDAPIRNHASFPSYSDIVGRYVTVDTLVHQATSYTEQLASPTSGAGYKKFRQEKERW